tara:strand:+ start:6496 stop:6849 length:354 start_codon:yes stop_codon:yes gene_type:complete
MIRLISKVRLFSITAGLIYGGFPGAEETWEVPIQIYNTSEFKQCLMHCQMASESYIQIAGIHDDDRKGLDSVIIISSLWILLVWTLLNGFEHRSLRRTTTGEVIDQSAGAHTGRVLV